MPEAKATRDPVSISTGPAVTTAATILGIGLTMVYPEMTATVSVAILGGAKILSELAGGLCRDYDHECQTAKPPREAGFWVRAAGKRLG